MSARSNTGHRQVQNIFWVGGSIGVLRRRFFSRLFAYRLVVKASNQKFLSTDNKHYNVQLRGMSEKRAGHRHFTTEQAYLHRFLTGYRLTRKANEVNRDVIRLEISCLQDGYLGRWIAVASVYWS